MSCTPNCNYGFTGFGFLSISKEMRLLAYLKCCQIKTNETIDFDQSTTKRTNSQAGKPVY